MDANNIALEILGTGTHTPGTRVVSEEIDRRLGKRPGWIRDRTGVDVRSFVAAGEDVITMGATAARAALLEAGVGARELDAIIAVGSLPHQAIPCSAVFLQRALGLGDRGIPAFDVNATCLGFLVALDLVAQCIATGRFRRVLLVASEVATAGLNLDDPATAGLFGDGAAAVVVGAARRSGPALLATHLETYAEGAEYCQVRAGGSGLHPRHDLDAFMAGTYFEMQGKATYRLAADRLPQFIDTLFSRAGVRPGDIDAWVPHQASGLAIAHLASMLAIPVERLVMTLATRGNQISASIPTALDAGRRDGRIRSGRLVALIGTGAGLSLGGAVLRI